MSNDVLSFLSASAEYHLLDVINDASNFRARGKRARLTVDDVNASLELRGAEVCSACGLAATAVWSWLTRSLRYDDCRYRKKGRKLEEVTEDVLVEVVVSRWFRSASSI